jgi:hypothetical protein
MGSRCHNLIVEFYTILVSVSMNLIDLCGLDI